MRLIVITQPQFFDGEAQLLAGLFDAGLQCLHLRKPAASYAETEHFLWQLPSGCLNRIVLHDHHALAVKYGLRGIHLNSRNPLPLAGYLGHVGCSCHSISELAERKPACTYAFLSPVYDSISKSGYAAGYSRESLHEAQRAGIIDGKTIALGGITADRFAELRSFGFGGVALLGDVWQRDKADILPHFRELLTALNT